jgi:hypothetical protein
MRQRCDALAGVSGNLLDGFEGVASETFERAD